MDRARSARGLVAARRIAGVIHAGGISRQLGAFVAAFLIAAPVAASDISFDPAITQSEFRKFSEVVAQAIYASPVQPARASGMLSFDVGVAANFVHVDTKAAYWLHSVPSGSKFIHSGYAAVPRLVVSKGFGAGTISASYAKVSGSNIKTWGAAVDLPIIRGTLATPELAVRGTYGAISGEDVLKLKTYGVELFLSKGFGPLTPYLAVGRMRTDSRGTVTVPTFAPIVLRDRSDFNRYTAGLRLSLFIPKLDIEATQAAQRSYAAKISVGF